MNSGGLRRRRVAGAVLIALIGLSLGSCSAGDDSNATSSETAAAQDIAVDGGEPGGGGAAGPASGPSGPAPVVQGERRDVVHRADLRVRVGDTEAAARLARDLVTEAEGFVAHQSSNLEGKRETSMTLRVPSAEFDRVVDGLAGLGEVQRRDLGSEDVTDTVVDLEARIANARVSAERLRELLSEADDVPEVLAIEQELTRRESEIEQWTGQLQVVQDRVAFSTITVHLVEQADDSPAVSDDLPGFVRSARAGGVVLVNIGLVGLAVVGFLVPFLPIVALAWFGHRWYRRRRPKPDTALTSASTATWPPAPPAPPPASPHPAPPTPSDPARDADPPTPGADPDT